MVVSPLTTNFVVTTKAAKARRSYEIKEKRQVVCQIDILLTSGLSWCRACESVGVKYLYYRSWKKLIKKIDIINDGEHFVAYNTKGKVWKIHGGCPGILKPEETQLKSFVFKVCEQGIQLMNRMIGREAALLRPLFAQKSEQSRIVCFSCSMRLTIHAATHTAQKHYVETATDTKDFITMVKKKLEGRNRDTSWTCIIHWSCFLITQTKSWTSWEHRQSIQERQPVIQSVSLLRQPWLQVTKCYRLS